MLVTLLAPRLAEAQVFTRHLDAADDLRAYVPFAVDDEVIYYAQPVIDFAAVLRDDRAKGKPTARVAVKVDKDYKLKDGVWSQRGSDYVWQIGFSAPKASSLNFHLRDVVLPEGAQLFVMSRDGRIIHGPVTAGEVYDEVYATDLIEASDVKIVVRMAAAGVKKFSLRVAAVNQGVSRAARTATSGELTPRAWGDAEDCQLDVNCAQGAGWQAERDAVAQLLVNGSELCTGTLVNDQCQDFRPFLLTAFHCLDIVSRDGTLSAAERDVSLWLVRFNKESTAPTCPGNTSAPEGVYLTYSGAAFRAASPTTDFALLELNGSVMNRPSLAMAGWDRSATAPDSTTIIHHPAGDAKKISFDFQAAIDRTITFNFTNARVWSVQLDLGTTEGGSSGSPYFSPNHRIVGQHASVQSGFADCDFTPLRSGGRFDLSWTGNGANDSRLSSWLGGTTPPMTINTLRVPWISPANAGGVPHYVCTTNRTFSLQNPPPGQTVTWSVSNPSLFASSGGASRSGSGTNAVLRAATSSASGSATLTFSITRTCNQVTSQSTLQVQLWVGRPAIPSTDPSGATPIQLGVGQLHEVFLTSAPGAPSFQANWTASGAVSRFGASGPSSDATFVGSYQGSGGWVVTTSNTCGVRSNVGQYNVGSGGCLTCRTVKISSPVRDALTITLGDAAPSELETATGPTGVQLVDQYGRPISKFSFSETSVTRDVSDLSPGLYFAKVAGASGEQTVKFVVLR